MTEEGESVLERLREGLEAEFEEARDEALLRKLWALGHAALGEEAPPFERTSQRWTSFGFQRDDPVSDLRGGGVLALRNLVLFLEAQPQFANAILSSRRPSEGAFDPKGFYPFAAAGVNLTKLLAADLAPKLRLDTDDAFDECYAVAFRLLDRIFDKRDASYMQFNDVLRETTQVLATALGGTESLTATLRLAPAHWGRESAAIRGVLRKLPTTPGLLGTRRVAQWRCRYFVLRGDVVAWYKPSSETNWRKAEVNGDLQSQARCLPDSRVIDRPGDPKAFKVEPILKGTRRVKLRLRADDQGVAAEWKMAFQAAIDRVVGSLVAPRENGRPCDDDDDETTTRRRRRRRRKQSSSNTCSRTRT